MKLVAYPGSFSKSIKNMLAEVNVNITWILTEKDARICKFDRLLLLGGADIWQGFYTPNEKKIAPSLRDCIESRLLVRAQEGNIPTLGICRGHQLIAAMNGAQLIQNINRAAHEHPIIPCYHQLGYIAKRNIFTIPPLVNSLHHQAAAVCPSGFRVMAKALDGTIEAIVSNDELTAGVQFHPEAMYDSIMEAAPLLWLLRGPSQTGGD